MNRKYEKRPRAGGREEPMGSIVIRHFGGMAPSIDPHDVTPGVSVRQINVSGITPGEMRVRLGCKQIRFEG